MTHKFTDLIQRVRVTLDQNQVEFSVLASDENTLQLDDIVRQKLLQAAKWLLERVPLRLIDLHRPVAVEASQTDTEGRLRVALPSDWLRLWLAKVSTWALPVRATVPADSEWGLVASSEFAGIRPCRERPLVLEDAGELVLCGSAGVLERLEYIPLPSVENNKMDFPVLLVDALVWLCASLVCDTLRDEAHGASFRAMAMSAAQLEQPSEGDKKSKR